MDNNHNSPTTPGEPLEQVTQRLARLEQELQEVRALLKQYLPDHPQELNQGVAHPPADSGSAGVASLDPQEVPVAMGEPEEAMELTSLDIDVLDQDDEIVVIADLPGFDEDEIEIQFTDAGLQIEGIQEEGEEELSGTYLVRERPHSWTRTVYLPDTVEREDTSVESVEFKNGRLTIILQESRIADQRIKI